MTFTQLANFIKKHDEPWYRENLCAHTGLAPVDGEVGAAMMAMVKFHAMKIGLRPFLAKVQYLEAKNPEKIEWIASVAMSQFIRCQRRNQRRIQKLKYPISPI